MAMRGPEKRKRPMAPRMSLFGSIALAVLLNDPVLIICAQAIIRQPHSPAIQNASARRKGRPGNRAGVFCLNP